MSDKRLPSTGPGRPKDQAKRLAILEAAKTLFMRNGYEGSSMDAIAAEAGVSKLTVYSHFTDKETLFAAAVKAKCEELMPELLFELGDEVPVETVLLNIGRAFHTLICSRESIALHRLMMSLAAQDAKLANIFYHSGPQQLLDEMSDLLDQVRRRGLLAIDEPRHAAEHFFCLIKGGHNFRLLCGCAEPMSPDDAEAHVREVVELFIRAYRP